MEEKSFMTLAPERNNNINTQTTETPTTPTRQSANVYTKKSIFYLKAAGMPMGVFHLVYTLVVTRNWWLILLSKIGLLNI
jgi:hypothetical protein